MEHSDHETHQDNECDFSHQQRLSQDNTAYDLQRSLHQNLHFRVVANGVAPSHESVHAMRSLFPRGQYNGEGQSIIHMDGARTGSSDQDVDGANISEGAQGKRKFNSIAWDCSSSDRNMKKTHLDNVHPASPVGAAESPARKESYSIGFSIDPQVQDTQSEKEREKIPFLSPSDQKPPFREPDTEPARTVAGPERMLNRSRQDAFPLTSEKKNSVSIESENSGASKPADNVEKSSRRKRSRKVLVGRREQDAANALLANKTDLMRVLSRVDCEFLAQLWIFNIQQLDCVLGASEIDEDDFLAEHADRKDSLYYELFHSLLSSDILVNKDLKHSQDLDTKDNRLLALTKMRCWKKQSADWKTSCKEGPVDFDLQFLLNGPISSIFSTYANNFFSSVPIKSAHCFLGLKKTETGIIIDYARAWRRKCDLPSVSPLSIAKHLLGLGQRLESALGSLPPADAFTRSWMGCALVVLSGAGKDFLTQELKASSALDFVNTRTKDIALRLEKWRSTNGLPVLKGTGKVAMVSAWKSAVKDALDVEAENGAVINSIDFSREAALEKPFVKEEKIAKIKDKRSPLATSSPKEETETSRRRKSDEEIQQHFNGPIPGTGASVPSKDPITVLSATNASFLSSIHITTANQFLSTRTTDVAKSYVQWRERMKMSLLKGQGAIATVSSWKTQVRKSAREDGIVMENDLGVLGPSSITEKKKLKRKRSKYQDDFFLSTAASPQKNPEDTSAPFSKRRFSVRGQFGVYHQFQLSTRKSSTNGAPLMYIQFLGSFATDVAAEKMLSGFDSQAVFEWYEQNKPEVFSVLPDSSDVSIPMIETSAPFSSILPGSGVIELSKYGVQAVSPPGDDQFDILTTGLRNLTSILGFSQTCGSRDPLDVFMAPSTQNHAKFNSNTARCPPNVYDQFGRNFLLVVRRPVEKGQCFQLNFLGSDLSTLPCGEPELNAYRVSVRNRIARLSLSSLREIQTYVHKNLAEDIVNETAPSSKYSILPLIARRRLHWILHLMDSHLQTLRKAEGDSESVEKEHNALPNFGKWTLALTNDIISRDDWDESKFYAVFSREVKREIICELCSSNFGDFSESKDAWCAIGRRVLVDAVDVMSKFVVGLEGYCSDSELADKLCSIVAKASFEVSQIFDGNYSSGNLRDVFFTFERFKSYSSGIFPKTSDVWWDCCHQDYEEAMSLVGEPTILNKIYAVATEHTETNGYSGGAERKPVLRMVNPDMLDPTKLGLKIHKKFYVERQIVIVCIAVVRCARSLIAERSKYPSLGNIESRLCTAAAEASGISKIRIVSLQPKTHHNLSHAKIPFQLIAEKIPSSSDYKPHSYQLFLGIVWPVLRAYGWKLEASDDQNDIRYLIPGLQRNNHLQIRLWKQNRAKRRAALAKQTNDLGLGYIPKDTKRLFATSLSDDRDLCQSHLCGKSVREVLNQFLASFGSQASVMKGIGQVLDKLCHCFDKVFPMLLYDSEKDVIGDLRGEIPSRKYGCQFLMRLFIMMPTLLNQANVPVQQTDDSLGVIQDVATYITSHRQELLGEDFQISEEKFSVQASSPSYLIPRLTHPKLKNQNIQNDNEENVDADDNIRDVVLPRDRPDLTDFISCCMSQAVVVRATEDDVARKSRGRSIYLGWAGLACKHCNGKREGRYFFSTIESLTTASTVLEKHLLKCPNVSEKIKETLVQNKTYHVEQRKQMPQGAQGAFFARLWKRMTSSKNSMAEHIPISDPIFDEPQIEHCTSVEKDTDDESQDEISEEFANHIWLLKYIQSKPPWNDNMAIAEAVDQYYSCLEYGGRIYDTKSMPLHFSSEWLLSKILPKFDGNK